MRKILIGLAAAIVIAAAGVFGVLFYLQHRVVAEVDAGFAQMRAAGGKASHGKVAFDLWSRTVTIADIAAQPAAQPAISVRIGSLTASGVDQQDERVSLPTASTSPISKSPWSSPPRRCRASPTARHGLR